MKKNNTTYNPCPANLDNIELQHLRNFLRRLQKTYMMYGQSRVSTKVGLMALNGAMRKKPSLFSTI